jgi:membrane-associated protein
MTEWLQQHGAAIGPWCYLLLGGLAFGEAAFLLGMVLPGETALLVGGFLAARGVLSLPVMIVVAVVCAIAGDSVGYAVGHKVGPPLKVSWAGRRVGPHRWAKAEAFLHKHGGKAVFLGRAVAVMRALVPGLAGMSRMPYRTFFPWNALGGLLWGAGCVLVGYFFAQSLTAVEHLLTYGGIGLVLVVIASMVGWHFVQRSRQKREELAEPVETQDEQLSD